MDPARSARPLLRRLEGTVVETVRGGEPVPIAFSAGLGSTVLVALARKRVEVVCIVAGTPDSPDVRAAAMAKDYMDYRVESMLLDRFNARRLVEEIRAASPDLTAAECGSLVPLWAARGRADRTILAGFGSGRLRPALRDALRAANVALPIASAARGAVVDRTILRAIARQLGLPPAFADVRRRAPVRGSGIDDFLHGSHV